MRRFGAESCVCFCVAHIELPANLLKVFVFFFLFYFDFLSVVIGDSRLGISVLAHNAYIQT